MSVALSTEYREKLREGSNEPNVIYEIVYTSFEEHLANGTYLADGSIIASSGDGAGVTTLKYGLHSDGMNDVIPIVDSPSALQTKLDIKKGYASKGSISFSLIGRDNFKNIIRDNYLKNRKVYRYDGFNGLAFDKYVKSFKGTIQNWSRKGDKLTITVVDSTYKTKLKLPVENANKTQYINYMNMNPVDVMLDILRGTDKLNIMDEDIDIATFLSERDTWLNGWKVGIILREPTEASNILNELQAQTNSFIIDDGQQISYKVVAPPIPSATIPLYKDDDEIIDNSASSSSGYRDFFNRIVIYFDYDESENDKEQNYETAVVSVDADSIGLSQWNEVKTKVIKSKLFRTYGWTQPINVSGIIIYHVGKRNGLNIGKTGSSIEYDTSLKSARWTAPDGVTGPWVKLEQDGVYQLFDADVNKSIKISVDLATLPTLDKSDTINITSLSGELYATVLGSKLLQKYSNPNTTINFKIDINKVDHSGNLLKVSDTIDIQSDEFCDKGQASWTNERMMITEVKPDLGKGTIALEAIQTRSGLQSGLKYAFIAPAGQPDYPDASDIERQYAYIGDANNKVNAGVDPGYYII